MKGGIVEWVELLPHLNRAELKPCLRIHLGNDGSVSACLAGKPS